MSQTPMPQFVAPMQPTLVKEPFDSSDWIFEASLSIVERPESRNHPGLSDLGREKHAREKIHGDREDHLPHRPRPANKSYPEEAEACRTCDAIAQGTCFVDSGLACT